MPTQTAHQARGNSKKCHIKDEALQAATRGLLQYPRSLLHQPHPPDAQQPIFPPSRPGTTLSPIRVYSWNIVVWIRLRSQRILIPHCRIEWSDTESRPKMGPRMHFYADHYLRLARNLNECSMYNKMRCQEYKVIIKYLHSNFEISHAHKSMTP